MHPVLRMPLNGSMFAMEAFMHMTGLLATWHLVPALEASPRPLATAAAYIRRRLLRICPAYFATLVLTFTVTWLATHPALAVHLPADVQNFFARPSLVIGMDRCATRGYWRRRCSSSTISHGAACCRSPGTSASRCVCHWTFRQLMGTAHAVTTPAAAAIDLIPPCQAPNPFVFDTYTYMTLHGLRLPRYPNSQKVSQPRKTGPLASADNLNAQSFQ